MRERLSEVRDVFLEEVRLVSHSLRRFDALCGVSEVSQTDTFHDTEGNLGCFPFCQRLIHVQIDNVFASFLRIILAWLHDLCYLDRLLKGRRKSACNLVAHTGCQ